MSGNTLEALSDLVSAAHARIQDAHQYINPLVSVRSGMRDMGIPADALTIDCLRARRRILLVLHDEEPGTVLYQFADLDREVDDDFHRLALADVDVGTLYQWMEDCFSPDQSPPHTPPQ